MSYSTTPITVFALFCVLFLNCFTMMIYKDVFGLKSDNNFWGVHGFATCLLFLIFIYYSMKPY